MTTAAPTEHLQHIENNDVSLHCKIEPLLPPLIFPPTLLIMHRPNRCTTPVVRGPTPPRSTPAGFGVPLTHSGLRVRPEAPTKETTMEMVKLDMALLAALSSFAFLAAVVFGMV
jgi:hypothetical protein